MMCYLPSNIGLSLYANPVNLSYYDLQMTYYLPSNIAKSQPLMLPLVIVMRRKRKTKRRTRRVRTNIVTKSRKERNRKIEMERKKR